MANLSLISVLTAIQVLLEEGKIDKALQLINEVLTEARKA